MKYRFEFAPGAIAKARDVHDWICQTSPEAAEKWLDGLFERIETLQNFPLRCPRTRTSEEHEENVRLLLYGKRQFAFRILFTVHDEVIRIIAIQDNARGPAEP